MQKEIEVKASISEPVVKRLVPYFNNYYGRGNKEFKSDTYFMEKDGSLFRLRRVDGKYIYTKKKNVIIDGVEANSEDEKELSEDEYKKTYDANIVYVEKTKEGYIWRTEDKYGYEMNIEVINVKGKNKSGKNKELGYFVEIEIITNEDIEDKVVCILKDELLDYFKSIGVLNLIESRKYISMIEDDK